MSVLSKKQLQHLLTATGIWICATLLCFPAGIAVHSLQIPLRPLLAAFLATGTAFYLHKLAPLPSPMRIGLLFPLAFTPVLMFAVFPHELMLVYLLILPGLLLFSQQFRFPPLPRAWFLIAVALLLFAGALTLLPVLESQRGHGLPRLPADRYVYLCLISLLPLGFASRPMLRPLAKIIARTLIWLLFLAVGLYPVIWGIATSFKIPSEPDRNYHQLPPASRFYLLPKDGIRELSPSELRNHPHRLDILRALDEMTWRLSSRAVENTFDPEGPISPPEMLRAMKLYEFLYEDRHGLFLPEESLKKAPPPEMKPEFLSDFRYAMSWIILTPEELGAAINVSPTEAEKIFREMEDLNLARRIPGSQLQYRLTVQARRPFENGLTPRQLLLTEKARDGESTEIVLADYVPRRQLPIDQLLSELHSLVDAGAAETRQVWQWNQHLSFLMSPARWRHSGLLLLAMLLALLVGRSLPVKPVRSSLPLLCAGGFLLFPEYPLPPGVMVALRVGLGLWLARHLLELNEKGSNRLSYFIACGFMVAAIMPLGAESGIVHHCAWILVWSLPALILLQLALRGRKKARNQTVPA